MNTVHSTNDLIDFLCNDVQAYNAWLDIGQRIAQHFFTPVSNTGASPDIKFYWQLNGLSYSFAETVSYRMKDLVREHLNRIISESHDIDDMHLSYDTINDVASMWADMLYAEIKSGAIQPPLEMMNILSVLYGEAGGNVAKTCRITGHTRHFVTKAKDAITLETYVRMTRVKSGIPYETVMNDCAPYCHEFPKFTPIRSVDDGDDADRLIQTGDLVAELGSRRWYVVGELGVYNGLVFTEKGTVSTPYRVLPKAYIGSASRFCSKINDEPASVYVHALSKY